MTGLAAPQRAQVVGTGLIGGSVALGLRKRGWHVTGTDAEPEVAERALRVGAIDAVGLDAGATVAFVAAPVDAIAAEAQALLAQTAAVVTDVGGVKEAVVSAVGDARFVGGHPMAGSEQSGIEGAAADLFEGAVWVLTPDTHTDPSAYTLVRSVVATLGADVVDLSPRQHDELVAVVSHVPHLTAAALVSLANSRASQHAALLRLAAGGFRDMTRIAAGSPTLWPDICVENREAIVATLDELLASLSELRQGVASADRSGLLSTLGVAQAARLNLPGKLARPAELCELRVPVPDRPGVIAEVTTLASELGINLVDFDIAHSSEGGHGVLRALIETSAQEPLRARLVDRGYRPTFRPLE